MGGFPAFASVSRRLAPRVTGRLQYRGVAPDENLFWIDDFEHEKQTHAKAKELSEAKG
jgi:hypothetical protein